MITILESTNIFDTGTQTFESILTGDLSDSKIVFQSDQLDTLSSLTFKVELYFDTELIFETITPVLYESGTTIGISNIDLSRPIRDYMITQTGISKYDDDIETQYNNFRKINNDAQLIIYEYDSGVEISGYTFDSYIYKVYEKDFNYSELTGEEEISSPTDIQDLTIWLDPSYGIEYGVHDTINEWLNKIDDNEFYATTNNGKNNYYSGVTYSGVNYVYYYNNSLYGDEQKLTQTQYPLYVDSGVTTFSIKMNLTSYDRQYVLKKNYSIDASDYILAPNIVSEDYVLDEKYETYVHNELYLSTFKYKQNDYFYNYKNNQEPKQSNYIHNINQTSTYSTTVLYSDSNNEIYGYVGDVLVYNRDLTDTEIKQVQKYLIDKYNIDFDGSFGYNVDFDSIISNRYYLSSYELETNSLNSKGYNYYNNVYRNSDLQLHFYNSGESFSIYGNNIDETLKWSLTETTNNTNYILNIKENNIDIYPNDNLEWQLTSTTSYYSGTTIDDFNDILSSSTYDIFTIYFEGYNKYNFKYNTNCEKYPHQLRWLNMIGGYDTFNFDLIHQESVQVSDKGYYKNNYGLTDTISTNDFRSSYQSYDRTFNKKYTFKTDWLTSDQIYLLEDLFKSTEVYYLQSDFGGGYTPEWLSMKNLTKTKELSHKDKFGLKRYEITLEESLKKEII